MFAIGVFKRLTLSLANGRPLKSLFVKILVVAMTTYVQHAATLRAQCFRQRILGCDAIPKEDCPLALTDDV